MNPFPPARERGSSQFIYDCEIDLRKEIKPLSWVQGRLTPRHLSLSTQNSTAWLPAEGLFCTVKRSLLIYTKSVILSLLLLARWKQGKLDLQESRGKKKKIQLSVEALKYHNKLLHYHKLKQGLEQLDHAPLPAAFTQLHTNGFF